jgi:MFS family permease
VNGENGKHAGEPRVGGLFGLRLVPVVDVLSRWPVFLVRFEWVRFRQMYRSARGPAGIMMWTNLLWVVPIAAYTQYAQIYARELGLSEVQVGYLASVTMAVSTVFYLVGGWLTDRLGYLRSILLFDALSWPLPMAVLAAADRPWHFYAAALLAGTMTAVVPAWNALFVSRVPPAQRAAAYGIHFILSTAPGLLFPLAGSWLVGRFGLVLSMRAIYLTTAWFTALGIALRWMTLAATPSLQERTPGLFETLRDQFGLYVQMAIRPEMRAFMLALFLINMDIFIGGTFVSIYCMEYLGLPKENYGWVSTAASAVRMVCTLALAPLITTRNTRRVFVLASSFLGLGSLVFLGFLYKPDPLLPLLPTVIGASMLWAVGGALWGPAITAQWVNLLPEKVRSRVWGAHGATNQLIGALALAVAGHLYHLWKPSLLVAFILLESGAVIFFARSKVGTEADLGPLVGRASPGDHLLPP